MMPKDSKKPSSSKESQDPLISFRVDPVVAEELQLYVESREAKLKHGIKISVSIAARDMMLEALARRRSEFKRSR
jgi:hypothetical protein